MGNCSLVKKAQRFLSSPITGQKPSSLADEQRRKGHLCCPRVGSRAWGRRCLLLKVIKIGQGFTFASTSHGCFAAPRGECFGGCLPLFLILGPSLSWCSEFEGRTSSFCVRICPSISCGVWISLSALALVRLEEQQLDKLPDKA